MKILVTGGAGYIGSFMVKRLLDDGFDVSILDSLERGHRESIDSRANLLEGNLLDSKFVSDVFAGSAFDAVIHFAGYISMAESMQAPELYFRNNTFGTLNLLEGMKKGNVHKIIFSSTAGVYGNPVTVPIPEDHQKNPTNPYGESKLMVEHILSWYKKSHDVSSISLRYFNAAGAALDGSMGEDHFPETHIIPNAIRAALSSSEFLLYGTDYPTTDGTAVRDYIHVLDLVEAHMLALNKLDKEKGSFIYNVGTGIGYSNKQVIAAVEEVSGKKIHISEKPRRSGDAEKLIADATRIKEDLHFEPKHSDLRTIVESAWKWHERNSK